MQPYSSTDMPTAWKNLYFILLKTSDFYMINNLSIAVHALLICIFTLLYVDKILLPRYVNRSMNFRGLPFNEKMTSLHFV